MLQVVYEKTLTTSANEAPPVARHGAPVYHYVNIVYIKVVSEAYRKSLSRSAEQQTQRNYPQGMLGPRVWYI